MEKILKFLRDERGKLKKLGWVSKSMFLVVWLGVLGIRVMAGTQVNRPISIWMHGVYLKDVLWEMERQSTFVFMYNQEDLDKVGKIDVEEKYSTVVAILDKCLKGTGLTYVIQNKVIVLKPVRENKKNIRISGCVTDEKKQPLPGVTVLVKGGQGTATDKDGRYTLEVSGSENPVVSFSFVGMETVEVKYTGQHSIDVVLRECVSEMEEVTVVSTGYQSVNRRDMVGSYTTLKVDDIKIASYSNVSDMLQGQIPGMVVTRTSARAGSSPKITIRGTATLGNTDPLFVVDGIIQDDPIRFNANTGVIDDMENIIGSQISWLNPSDIETITVLKDASATAIYGARASNGVIVVTTKKPQRSDRILINYTGSLSIAPRPAYSQFNLMNSRERVAFSDEAFKAGAKYAAQPIADVNTFEGIMRLFFDGKLSEADYLDRKAYLETMNTNWLKLLTQTGVSYNHNLSVSGASNVTTYLFSVGYNNDEGQEKGNNSERFTSRMALNMRLYEKVRLAFNMNATLSKSSGYAYGVNPLAYATSTSRAIPAYEEDGGYAYYLRTNGYKYNGENRSLSYSILNEMENTNATVKNGRISIGVDLTWNISSWLKYQLTGGYSYTGVNSDQYATERSYYIANAYRGYDYGSIDASDPWYRAAQLPFGGELFSSSATQHSYSVQNKLLIQKNFDEDNRLNVMLGTEVRSTRERNTQTTFWGYVPDRGYNFIRPNLPENIKPLGASSTPSGFDILNALYDSKAAIAKQKNNFFSLFATLAYSLKNRYVFNFSMRNDASNRFGQDANNHFDPICSFGLSWRASAEEWMAPLRKVVSDLNFKVTYGIQGNADLTKSPDLILHLKGIKDLYNSYYSTISSIPNPDLSWERTRTWNLGLEFQLFRRVNFVLDYYERRSNAVISQDIPYENGMSQMSINGGRLYNKGFEATLSFNPVNNNDFGINVSVNASRNWNKGGATPFEATYKNYLNGISSSILKEGYPVNGFWSYSFAGLNPQNGEPMFNNMEVDEVVAKDDPTTVLVYSGTKDPNFTGGMNWGVRYKSFTLTTNFSLLLGGHKRLPSPYRNFPSGVRIPDVSVNLSKELNKRWKNPGDEKHTDIPALLTGRYMIASPFGGAANLISDLYENSDVLVASASFLRCRNLALCWRMNREMAKKFGLQNFQATVSISNLFVIASKRYHGFDPELTESVMPKSYSLSLSIGF